LSSPDPDEARWIRRFGDARPDAQRLLCLPHAGGSAPFFLPVSRALAPSVDVLAVQYPGRQDRRSEPFADSIADLAEQLYVVIERYLDRPLFLFGHSMGSVVAFELAGLMERRRGISPATLFLSGRRAPSRRYDETVHQRDDNGIVAEMKSLSGTDDRILGDEDLLRMVLPAIRADYRIVETYRPGPTTTVAAPISVLVGDNDQKATVPDAEAWREHTTGDFDLTVFPGGHFYLVEQAPKLLAHISGRIAAVSS
jgi:pyochelin biosynthesis protein PchC